MKWKDLPLSERASYIEVGVRNGLSSMRDIRDAYNKFEEGGPSYWSVAKDFIKSNEGFFKKSYADAPKGKSWRSVGYGFNDSGFYSKYPMGISAYYDKRGGITRAEAEKELEWVLTNLDSQAKRIYGKKWDTFNDNQKAALIDVMYQRPASASQSSQFYKAIQAGNKDAWSLLGVTGYNSRNKLRRELAGKAVIPTVEATAVIAEPDATRVARPTYLPTTNPIVPKLQLPQDTSYLQPLPEAVQHYDPFSYTPEKSNYMALLNMIPSDVQFKSKVPELILPNFDFNYG